MTNSKMNLVYLSLNFIWYRYLEPEVQPKSKTYVAHAHLEEKESTVDEMLDGRLTSLREMGFTLSDSEWALQQCNDDVNEALNLLLSGERPY
jgi:uncharacterized UBP type Zn finger protein